MLQKHRNAAEDGDRDYPQVVISGKAVNKEKRNSYKKTSCFTDMVIVLRTNTAKRDHERRVLIKPFS